MSSSDFSNIFDMIVFVVGILTLDWVGLLLVEIFFSLHVVGSFRQEEKENFNDKMTRN